MALQLDVAYHIVMHYIPLVRLFLELTDCLEDDLDVVSPCIVRGR